LNGRGGLFEMAIPRSVNLSEPGDIEILNLYTSIDGKNISIAECPNDEDVISVIVTDGGVNGGVNFIQLLLNKEEAWLVVSALNELCCKE